MKTRRDQRASEVETARYGVVMAACSVVDGKASFERLCKAVEHYRLVVRKAEEGTNIQ